MEKEDKLIDITKSQKIASIFLIINAFFVLLGILLDLEDETRIIKLLVSSIVDIILAISILRNNDKWLKFMKFRIIFGMLVFSITALSNNDYWGLSVQIIMSTSIVLLFFGDAGKIKKIISITLFSILCLLYVEGTIAGTTSRSILGYFRFSLEYNLKNIEENENFNITKLPQMWKMRVKESYTNDSPDIDLWLIDPSSDSHIMIIYEELDDYYNINHNRVVENVKNNALKVSEIEVLSEITDKYKVYDRTLLKTYTKFEDYNLKYFYSILSNDKEVIQIICFTREEYFENIVYDFENFIKDFSIKI